MNRNLKFRSLLTTTSMVALLAAPGVAHAATYDNPFGTTIDQMLITTTVPYVNNSGTIENDTGASGIDVEGTTVYGQITNSYTGVIDVENSEDGDAIGIKVYNSYIEGVANNSDGESDYGEITAKGTEETGGSGSSSESYEAEASATGIQFYGTSNSGSIYNQGSIDAEAKSGVDQSATDNSEDGAEAYAQGYSSAYAAGIDVQNDGPIVSGHDGPVIASYVDLYGTIDATATANSSSDASASSYYIDDADAFAYDHAYADSYGVRLSGTSAYVGGIHNDAEITATATVTTQSDASAWSEDDSAWAAGGWNGEEYCEYEGSIADASATGLLVDVLHVDGNIYNGDTISASATAQSGSVVSATGDYGADAYAENDYTDADATGIYVDALLVSGGFDNEGDVSATSNSSVNLSATATAYGSDAYSSAYADEVDASSTGIDLNIDGLGGPLQNSAELVSASATASAITSATSIGGEYSDAYAEANVSADSIGINADIGSIAGNFDNSGDITSTALATGSQTATVSSNESLTAKANGEEIDAFASGIDLSGRTLAGSFINTASAITVSATAQSTSTATATGLDDLYASAANDVSVNAYGIRVEEGDIQDSVYNEGALNVTVLAEATQTATSTADLGQGDAAALAGNFFGEYGDDVSASSYATGLYVDSEEGDIGGNIVNDGVITVDAASNITSTVEATAYGTGEGLSWGLSQADSVAYGIRVQDVGVGSYDITDEGAYPRGYFVNLNEVSATASSNTTQTVTANADDGNAGAGSYIGNIGIGPYSEDGAHVQATGIELDDVGLLGSFLNYDQVHAMASAEATLTANSNVNDGDETLSVALAGGSLDTAAYGIVLNDVGVNGDTGDFGYDAFYNDGAVTAIGYTNLTADANAYSDDGAAVAISGVPNTEDGYNFSEDYVYSNYADASATGIRIYDSYIDGDVSNDAVIFAGALARIDGTAEANGDESALAVAGNSAYADAVGFDISDSSIDGDVYNNGLIIGAAGATGDTTAHAFAQQATATIGSEYTPYTEAYATGLSVDEEDGTSIHNSEDGVIVGIAGASGQNDALAEGWSNADAYVEYEESAGATGVYSSSEYGSTLFNDGLIIAGAVSYGDQTATATASSASGSSNAEASDSSEAEATGVSIVGSLENTGVIFAGSLALSNADASATGHTAYADASAYAEATATAASIGGGGSEDWEYIENSGTISALAVASATATAATTSSFAHPDLSYDVSAEADATAIGIDVLCGTYLEGITNSEDGVISASASASTTENDEIAYDGSARATALRLNDVGLDGNITNDGVISATATADGDAYATGIDIEGSSSYVGSLTNSGTIQASATGDYASATAIRLDDGGSLNTISNTGDILAYLNPDEPSVLNNVPTGAVAIDAEGEGQGLTIEQLGGHIVGKILLSNSYSDHIEWSGGTIQGDIYGNHGEDGNDVLDIFAGTDNAFTYADTIDGFDAVRLNDDASDAVSLRLTGSINNTNSLYVGSHATLSLSSDASVNVDSLTVASTGTLSYDLNSDGTNAVINTSTADLGGGTVKAVFTDVQHPTDYTYRIINWDGSDTTFGTVLSNSILEKVTAQYSEDGVDLLVTKVSFGGLDNLQDDAQRLGHALDGVFANIPLDSDLGKALTDLIGLSPEEYERTMNEIAGQQLADLQTATTSQLGDLLHVIQTQLSGMRGSQQASLGMDSLGIMVADNQVTTMSDAPVAGASAPVFAGNWSAWARAFGDWASLKRDGFRPGFTSDAGGVVAGVDYKLTDDFMLGLAGGYQKTNMDFRGTGDGDITSWSVTAYGDYSFGPAYVDTLVGYSTQSYDLNRFLNVLGTGYTANSNYDGSSVAASIEAGYAFDVADNTKVTPFVGFNYTHTNADAVTETGAGIWNLAYDSRSDNAFDSVLGTRLSYAFKTADGTRYLPTVELGWKHQYGDATPTTNAALAGTPGSNFLITGQEAQRDSALVGASLGVQLTDQIDGSVQYNGQYSSNYSDSTASVRLRLKF